MRIIKPTDAVVASPTSSSGPFSITVEFPTASEKLAMIFLPVSRTISKMRIVLKGSSPSVTWTLKHGTDYSAAGTAVVTAGTTTTNTTVGQEITVFDNPTTATNSWVWLETSAISGTVTQLSLDVIL